VDHAESEEAARIRMLIIEGSESISNLNVERVGKGSEHQAAHDQTAAPNHAVTTGLVILR